LGSVFTRLLACSLNYYFLVVIDYFVLKLYDYFILYDYFAYIR
jgi:hypothetical protein